MSEGDFTPSEPEVALREENTEPTVEYAKRPTIEDEVVRLRAENTALKVENATLKTNNTWLARGIWGLIGLCVALVVALWVLVGNEEGKASKKEKASKKASNEASNDSRTSSLLPLFKMLKEITTQGELVRILDLYLPGGSAVALELSTATSPNEFFHQALGLLKRHGHLDGGAFFSALIEAVPSRTTYILKVQAEFFAGLNPNDDPT